MEGIHHLVIFFKCGY